MKSEVTICTWGSLFVSITPESAEDVARLALFAMNANADARKVSQVSVSVGESVSVGAWINLGVRKDSTPRNPTRRQLIIKRANP